MFWASHFLHTATYTSVDTVLKIYLYITDRNTPWPRLNSLDQLGLDPNVHLATVKKYIYYKPNLPTLFGYTLIVCDNKIFTPV